MNLLLLSVLAASFQDQVAGTVLNAQLKPIANVTVKLSCASTGEPSGDNHWRSRCDSTLTVERDGQRLARLASQVSGIDFEQVAGNSGSLELSILEPGLIVVTSRSREGDLWSRESEFQQLFVVDGKSLRTVYAYQSLKAYEPGPDGKDQDRERSAASLSAGPVENGLPTLRLSRDGDVLKVTWSGVEFINGNLLSDAVPLIARVVAGQRLKADELKPINQDDLGKLRNAPYARHGRPFKNPALQAYFYGSGKLTPNPGFRESQLDAADRANLSLILDEIKSR